MWFSILSAKKLFWEAEITPFRSALGGMCGHDSHSRLFLFVSLGLCEPPFLVPVLLWVFRNVHDWLLGLDLLQPPFHICTSSHLWSPRERCVCRDPHAAARSLQEWPEVRGGCSSRNLHTNTQPSSKSGIFQGAWLKYSGVLKCVWIICVCFQRSLLTQQTLSYSFLKENKTMKDLMCF